MYSKRPDVFYIADSNGKLINKGFILSIEPGKNGEIIIKVKEQGQYKHRRNNVEEQKQYCTA